MYIAPRMNRNFSINNGDEMRGSSITIERIDEQEDIK